MLTNINKIRRTSKYLTEKWLCRVFKKYGTNIYVEESMDAIHLFTQNYSMSPSELDPVKTQPTAPRCDILRNAGDDHSIRFKISLSLTSEIWEVAHTTYDITHIKHFPSCHHN